MSYIDKRVFPTSGRQDSSDSDVDLGTNLLTEYNITNLINSVCDYDDNSTSKHCGFVLASGDDSRGTGNVSFQSEDDLDFIIRGYYFKLKTFNPSISSWETEYVKIDKTDDSDIIGTINIISPSNISYKYLDKLSDTNWDDSGEKRQLLLLKKGDSEWYIPNESRKHSKGYSLTGLDEGEI